MFQIAFDLEASAAADFRALFKIGDVLSTIDSSGDMLSVIMDFSLALDAGTNHSCKGTSVGICGMEIGHGGVVDC